MSPRKNKHDSTTQAVDFLNSVMDNTSLQSKRTRVRRLPSRPVNRFMSREPRVLRSDHIWDIPSSSPEKTRPASRRVQEVASSPRRSLRIQTRKVVRVEDTPRRSVRLARVRGERDYSDEDDDEDDDEDGEEDEDEDEDEYSDREGLDEIIDKQLAGRMIEPLKDTNRDGDNQVDEGQEDEDSDGQDDHPLSLPSPPRVFDNGLNSDSDESEGIPNRTASKEFGDGDGPAEQNTSKNRDETNKSPEPENSDSERDALFEYPDPDESEAESETVSEANRPASEVEEDLPQASPTKRRRTDQCERSPRVEIVRRRPTSPMAPADLSILGSQGRRSRHHSREDVETQKVSGDKSWFAEASALGQQKDNWDILIEEASELSKESRPSRAEQFREIEKHLSQLRTKYTKINRQLKSQHGPLRENLRECEDLREIIAKEGFRVLDSVYYLSVRREESHRLLEEAEELVEEFEARVIPVMIKMILLCFEAYYTNKRLFPSSLRHLAGVMKLLLRFCSRVVSLRAERYVFCRIHSPTIRKAVRKLIEALDANMLQRRHDDDRPGVGEHRNWTEDEKVALLDGLQLFQGDDRYVRLVCHFGRQLRHRTLQELQIKAREMHDRLIPRIQDELLTVEGRRRWQWLLSV